jgi:mono/diheme cytochrome c family protein
MQSHLFRAITLGLAGLMLASCSIKVANDSNIKSGAAARGTISISSDNAGVKSANTNATNAEELDYAWRYPKYPEDYNINLDNRDPNNGTYMSNRETVYDNSTQTPQQETALGPLGSYAGPWIEGEEAKLLPVSNPNIPLGTAILKVIGSEVTPEMKPILEESPFQGYLKLRGLGTDSAGKLRTITITMPTQNPKKNNAIEDAQYTIQLDKEALWSVTMTLYREISPEWTTRVPVKSDPASLTDEKKRKDGAGVFGNCNMCHGADGWGLGHSGLKLQPPPANFHETRRLFNRSEAHLREVLHHGIYGSAMPPWGDKLGDQEIAVVVAYLRHFTYSTEAPVMSSPPTFKDQ